MTNHYRGGIYRNTYTRALTKNIKGSAHWQ